MGLFGAYAWSRQGDTIGDVGNLAVTCAIAAPDILGPMFFAPTSSAPFYERYWFKFNVWIAIFTFIASYFFTEYFFDVLGMVYNFQHLKWTFDSELLGMFLVTYITLTNMCLTLLP